MTTQLTSASAIALLIAFHPGTSPAARSSSSPAAEVVAEQDQTPSGIINHTLKSAHTLYRDMLRARRAARTHNTLDARMALSDADRVLDELFTPTQLSTLMHESAVIREDLKDTSHDPDPHLWLPLQAELTRLRVELPNDRVHRASQAIHAGTRAASKGDRAGVVASVDDLEKALGYRFALIPLRRIREDLDSANAAMLTDPPRWQGVYEAVESALGSIRWVSDMHARGWISAYQHAADAVDELGHDPARARASLLAVTRDLYAWPQGAPVIAQARRLAETPRLNEAQLFDLLGRIGALLPGITPA